MIYPSNAAEKLGFEEIKRLLGVYCLSDMGRELVAKIQPQHRYDQVERFLRQTHEFKEILQHDSAMPIEALYPIRSFAEKARVEGVYLLEEDFFHLLLSLRTVFGVIHYFGERQGQYPALEALFEHLPIEKTLLQSIERIIDQRGKMRDDASPALKELTLSISRAEMEARKRMDAVYKQAQQNGWTADGSLTVRDGRLCIPVLAENKRKLKGFIHDESASGQTAYIEPEEVFELNNRVRDLIFDRRREVIRILQQLTDAIRPHIPLIIAYHGLLTKLDFVRAKALFAVELGAEMPELTHGPALDLVNARHPLLMLSLKKEQKQVVPLNVRIDEEQRIIVVSGPNAGGKSVAMKTIGLLQLMVQSGILIPAESFSKVGVFRRVFADIGDDQSIESDLSTYSAHLAKMRYFTERAGEDTLILIDEFGTGTDPQFGGPIAEAVLEVLNRRKSRGVVTTHYSNLKNFANATEGLENASMLFDNVNMSPLYMLQVGKPGSSYAFEIAQKIGLPREVLELARKKIGDQQKRVESLLVNLERDKKTLLDEQRLLERRTKDLKQLEAENANLKNYLEENRRNLIRDAKEEAQAIIRDANKLIENTIAEIKSSQADKVKTKELRKELSRVSEGHQLTVHPAKEIKKDAIVIGDWVKVLDSGNTAQVMEIAKDNLILAVGDLRMVVKSKKVKKVSGKEVPKSVKRANAAASSSDIAGFYPEIDVRGKRTEQAIQEIEKYLDRAIMMGFPSLKIIHGKGDGILRKMIRDYLRKYTEVNRMEDEHADRGGDGITNVYLN